MNPRYPDVARRASRRCEYCRAPEELSNIAFEVEHVYPVARGGSSEITNLALGCRACNMRKGSATEASDPLTGEVVPLFDPRADRWTDHFCVDPDSCEILGTTPTGRATAERLDMNHPNQLTARPYWVGLRLFP